MKRSSRKYANVKDEDGDFRKSGSGAVEDGRDHVPLFAKIALALVWPFDSLVAL